jgi:hypothetical protein
MYYDVSTFYSSESIRRGYSEATYDEVVLNDWKDMEFPVTFKAKPQFSLHLSGQWKNSAKPSPTLQLRLRNSFIDQMPNQSTGRRGRNGGGRESRCWGAARPIGANTNRSLIAVGGPLVPQGQSPDAGQSSRGRGIVRWQSVSHQTRRTRRRQTNEEAGPNERRPRVIIRGNQLYVGRTRINPRILEHPLMALRLVMP